MPIVPADLRIEARWILPMTDREHILEHHSLVIRDARILDILPSASAAATYAATMVVQRPSHLLMPGLINAHGAAAAALFRGCPSYAAPLALKPVGPHGHSSLRPHSYSSLGQRGYSSVGPQCVRDGTMLAIADMLRNGITCFADRFYFPSATAAVAAEQGMRAVIGLPIAETPSAWAASAAECLTEGLKVRDEYHGHPSVSTLFAPHPSNTLSDPLFARLAMLVDELDAGVMIDLHESAAEIDSAVAQHGMRPIERLLKLGLLSPSLHAVHMVHASPEDIELAARTGIAVSLCPQSSLRQGFGFPPVNALAAAGIRLGLGAVQQGQDLWGELKLLAGMAAAGSPPLGAWEVLHMATRGGATVLGLESETGSLEVGKWADLCCVDLSGPALQPGDPVTQLVFCGGRDIVSDVWVAGRPLLVEGALTRLDWPAAAERAQRWAERLQTGE